VVAAVVAVVATLGPAGPARSVSGPRSTWIVQLADPPLAGRRLDPAAAPVRASGALLDHTERRVLAAARAGGAPVLHHYRRAFSGFAAKLTASEAAALARTAGVAAVSPDTVSHPLATRGAAGPAGPDPVFEPRRARGATAVADGLLGRETPAFLGLPAGLWARLGGFGKAGEGVTIGVIDTGIYPEHPSFADVPLGPEGRRYGGPPYRPEPPPGWKGTCQAGAGFPATACNHKLIGARYFVDGFGAANLKAGEFLSPRDANGHGSHVAATAAGNYGVAPKIGGHDLGIPAVSGIAPRARIAAYKICWTGKAATGEAVEGSCMASDAVAAIDAAVADGVDVINYSVGSATSTVFGPVERAFLGAAAAGVFVANAAGNDGPKPGTIGSPTGVPWVTSVAATTLGRTFESTFSVTPGAVAGAEAQAVTGVGGSLTGALDGAPLVDAAAVPAAGVAVDKAVLCLPGSLDAVAVAGKAVLCQRGQNARVEKGKVVRDAGGVGMVLANTKPEEDVVADLHWVPAVHVPAADGVAIRARLAGGVPARLTIGGSHPAAGPADRMAAFSSRGPEAAVPDVAKPDLGAPGVNILAAGTPTPVSGQRPGETFQIISGTSMASPEVAGAAALLAQLQRDWSPAEIKSALMTSAEPKVTEEDGTTPAGPLDVGSGRIDPNRAATPGLVVDTPVADYVRYLKGQAPDAVADGTVVPLAAADLNLPSVAFSRFTGQGSTVRTFTSVDTGPQSWVATVEAPAGLVGTVAPAAFDIAPGATRALTLSLAPAGAPAKVWASGALVLTNAADGRRVRLPVTVRPVKIDAGPSLEVVSPTADGTAVLPVRAGYAGSLAALGWGLAPPRPAPGQTVATASPTSDHPWVASAAVRTYDVEVPPGTQVLAGEISNVPGGGTDTDLDLYLFRDADGKGFDKADAVALSAGPGAAESIALALPPPGSYRFAVVGFKTRPPSSTFDFTTWLGAEPSPNDPATPSTAPRLVVAAGPQPVSPGAGIALPLAWSGAAAEGTYFGLVTYHDQDPADPQAPAGATIIRLVRAPPDTPPRAGPGTDRPG
jgi:subtilisin family serine protease